MNLVCLAGHTIDESLLPEDPVVLDVGCRSFDFCQEILNIRPSARIIAMDPDPDMEDPQMAGVEFVNKALVFGDKASSGYASYSTGEGNMLTDLESYYDARMLTVECVQIARLMEDLDIEYWDLVKLDCEGSEFDILANWPGPIANQISVEFHDGHPQREGAHREPHERYFNSLWSRLADYKVVQHIFFKQGDWFGHWDSLFVLNG